MAKSFGATKALTDASLSVSSGEIVALLGENGSGKSTLVKTLSGVLRPDSGQLSMGGKPLTLPTPRAALKAGIVTVFQEILVAPDLSVVDNLWLGSGSPFVSRGEQIRRRTEAERTLAVLSPDPPALDIEVGRLDLMQQQICVIARGLLRQPKLLVLDEVTSTLDVTIRDRFFAELRRLCANGAAALFISHRMDEVMTLADRFVALRSGRTVGTLGRQDATAGRLVRLISGEQATEQRKRAARGVPEPGNSVLEAGGVTVRPGAKPVSLTVRRGEIIGLAGLEGHGQDEFLRMLAGLLQPAAGQVGLLDRDAEKMLPVRSYRQAVRLGLAYVPRDRKGEGIADVLSSLDNFSVPTLSQDALAGVVRPGGTRERFRALADVVNLAPRPKVPAGRLSGGNQQKVILARWLATDPRILLLNDPTRGVDLRTKYELYDLFERLTENGMSIVMLSTEVEEHLHLMDRVLVFHSGSCVEELSHAQTSRDALVAAYFGHRQETLVPGGTQ
ncbi:sugar ABC transporter ATP-binding protein [Streptomyces canus]|uniref:sugar ABC transporter ATP-binding protein n=1 Tax=Streptomyces canus TaxID=58343 RepID=UPI0033DB3F7A